MNIKKNINLLQFNQKFKKLKKNIVLKNLKLYFLKKYDVIVFVNFNFYNSINISVFKDILETNNIKYTYIKSNDYNIFLNKKLKLLQTNIDLNIKNLCKNDSFWCYNFINFIKLFGIKKGLKQFYYILIYFQKFSIKKYKNFLFDNNLIIYIKQLLIWKNSYFFNKNFNVILFLNYKNINNNVLETLKLYAKVDPLYLKFKTHKKLLSYDFLCNNLLKNYRNLSGFKPLICTLSLYNQIRILKILKVKNNI